MLKFAIINKIVRLLFGLIIIFSIFGVKQIHQASRIKKQLAIKGVQSANLSLPQIQTDEIPVLKTDSFPVQNFYQGVLLDADSLSVLFGKEQEKSVPIASLTKLMTAAVALENYQLSETVDISQEATRATGSKIFASAGEKFTVDDLLQALLISSANDAALALANHKFSTEDFVVLMDAKAAQLGMKRTTFKDPAGLNDEGVSSARDIGILLAYALRNPIISQIIRQPEKTIYNQDKSREYRLENSNRLVKEEMYFQGIIGGKTGFTPKAGHNLTAAAERNGHTLIAVVINTYSSAPEASAQASRDLLNWGFENFEWKKI